MPQEKDNQNNNPRSNSSEKQMKSLPASRAGSMKSQEGSLSQDWDEKTAVSEKCSQYSM
jgi:hypothetical protein